MQFPLLSLTRFLCGKRLETMQEVKLNKFHTSIMFLANSPIITRLEYYLLEHPPHYSLAKMTISVHFKNN
jgi:hypothetical protein